MTTTNDIINYRNTVDYDLGRKMKQNIHFQISDYICDVIKPVNESITDWDDLLDWVWDDNKHGVGIGGYSYKRLDNPDAESMTDEQFNTLCKMTVLRDLVLDIYPE